ncbi:hypothetical protein K0M31_010490, partial [Melipona bicolor]
MFDDAWGGSVVVLRGFSRQKEARDGDEGEEGLADTGKHRLGRRLARGRNVRVTTPTRRHPAFAERSLVAVTVVGGGMPLSNKKSIRAVGLDAEARGKSVP